MQRQSVIYAMLCPENAEIKYVGKTSTDLRKRLASHIRRSKKGNNKKDIWLRKLATKPILVILDRCSVEQSSACEREWMDCLSRQFNLLNIAPGGGGNPHTRTNWTPELISLLGKVPDTELAKRIGVDVSTILYRRKLLKIDRVPQKNFVSNLPPSKKKPFSKESIELLGKAPDHEIAKIEKVSKTTVLRRRQEMGIDSYAKQTGNDGKFKIGESHRRWKK